MEEENQGASSQQVSASTQSQQHLYWNCLRVSSEDHAFAPMTRSFVLKHSVDEGLRNQLLVEERSFNIEHMKSQINIQSQENDIRQEQRAREGAEENQLQEVDNIQILNAHKLPAENKQQVDKLTLSNTSTTKPTEEKQAVTEQEDNELTKATDLADASFLMKVLRSKLVKTKNEVEVQTNDPSSPLYSVKSFEELPLSEQLRRGVYDMGFNKPSKIQETALPMLLADPPNNMIAQSQSGTGKTAAFVLPMLSRVDATKNFPQAICISPTYQLALQTGQVAEKMAKFCPEVKIGYALRGERVLKGQKLIGHIIFATSGTLLYWIQRHRVLDPKKIKMIVLDEADVMMAQQGHQDQVIRIYRTLPKDCQMLLFSSTYDDEVMKFAKTVVPDPIIIRLRREEESLDNIKQYYVVCRDKEDKFQALSNMYGVVSIGQCIVFCHTRKSALLLARKMTADGHSVALLSGEMRVEQRLAVLNRFREGRKRLLIATNVSVRGIDVEQVNVVINYDMPVQPTGQPDYQTYLRSIGRTGRFGKSGIAVNFINGQRWSMTIIKKIEEHFGKKIWLLQTDDVDELEKVGSNFEPPT